MQKFEQGNHLDKANTLVRSSRMVWMWQVHTEWETDQQWCACNWGRAFCSW